MMNAKFPIKIDEQKAAKILEKVENGEDPVIRLDSDKFGSEDIAALKAVAGEDYGD